MAPSGSVILVGATGGVGRLLMSELLETPRCQRLVVLTRRATGHHHARLEEHQVDFERPSSWPLLKAEVVFLALGTTLKAAGSEAAQYRVDHDYQVQVATLALRSGVSTCVLVSSNSANLRAPSFYGRMKAEVERDVAALPFKRVCILRPGVIEGSEADERASATDVGVRPLSGVTLARAAVIAAYAEGSVDRPRRSYGPSDLARLAGVATPAPTAAPTATVLSAQS